MIKEGEKRVGYRHNPTETHTTTEETMEVGMYDSSTPFKAKIWP